MKYPPLNPKFPHMLHGGDYNPDQWLHMPEILQEDLRLMKLSHCNAMSTGIFAWAALEPEEGRFTFDWLDKVMDDMYKNRVYTVLATPSGARPAWMSVRYPEVLRVAPDRTRNLHGTRHNHCFTSPVYREKTTLINRKLAERYKNHPGLLLWHLSNEYGGECHCPLCQEAFRGWLQKKYRDLDVLNRAWYTAFWSHTYSTWEQIESPSPKGEPLLHGLNLDWKRFVTDQTLDFMKMEIRALKEITPDIPVTTNFMGTYGGLNYWKMAADLDVISWDNYPQWQGNDSDVERGSYVAFVHNLNRSLKGGQPYMLMESTPSMTNWQPYAKLKRPGVHLLSSIQAVAHGSDTVQYFQWRKSRGSSEKLHGAVVDHVGHEHNRVFREVTEVGQVLAQLDEVVGTSVPAEVAVLFDWENRWALEDAHGPRNDGLKDYEKTCHFHSIPFWRQGIPFDVIDMDQDFSKYKIMIAPMLYMVRPGVAERLEQFVAGGGTLVTTYWSGIVDEHDLCFLGGFPGPLRKLTGIWAEEIDALGPDDRNQVAMVGGNELGMSGKYEARIFCDLIHAETARVLAVYGEDFYAGRPALTVNTFGKGKAYYVAARTDEKFLCDFYGAVIKEMGLRTAIDAPMPEGVAAHYRTDGKEEFVFVMNFTGEEQNVTLGTKGYRDMITGEKAGEVLVMKPYGVRVLKTARG